MVGYQNIVKKEILNPLQLFIFLKGYKCRH